MQDNIKDRYLFGSPVRRTIEILDEMSDRFLDENEEGTAKAMQTYNQIIRDITGVTPHWEEVA